MSDLKKWRKLFITGFFLLGFLFFCKPTYTFAAEKNMNVELTSGYAQADFYFTFVTEQTYNITVTDPYGEENKLTILGKTGTVSITNVVTGTYEIKIEADSDIEFNSSPRVEMLKSDVQSDKSNISVSTNVSNLKIWFDNGVLKAKWDDTNIGKVNIQIKNPSNMETLANSTVDGTSFSYELSNSVTDINFFIVPSNSAKVNGAGSSYSVHVVRSIPGDIIFAEESLFNVNSYMFKANLYGRTSIRVRSNDLEVYNSYFEEPGTYDIEVPLNDLENKFVVDVIDEKGNINSYTTVIKKDIVAPKLTLNNINDITRDSSIIFSGSVTEAEYVEINGVTVPVSNGQFRYEYPLEIGDNYINLSATDIAGNTITNNYLITRTKMDILPLLIVLFIIFVGVVAVLIYFRIKNQLETDKQNNISSALNKESTKAESMHKKTEDIQKKIKDTVKRSEPLTANIKTEASISAKVSVKEKIDAKSEPTRDNNEDTKTSVPTQRKYADMLKVRESKVIKGNIIAIACFAICLFIIFNHFIMFTTVMSGSMEPTLSTGDYVIYNRLAYKVKNVERGDIVCFYFAEDNKTYAKRVIGIPGDVISFKDGYIFINDVKIKESYIASDIETNSAEEFIVPENKVFLLGDNRENSYDSRYWESAFIDMQDIYGKYIGTLNKIF